MKKSLKKRIEYDFDKAMSKGIASLLYLLILIVLFVSIVLGVVSYLLKPSRNIFELIWNSFTHMLDPGVISEAAYCDFSFTVPMLIATLFGVLFTATLIGIINSMISDKLELLRKGESKILDEKHTIILGYDDITYNIINQLLMAYVGSKKKHLIVVVGNKEKCEMEEEIKSHIKGEFLSRVKSTNYFKRKREKRMLYDTWKKTTIICRKGTSGEKYILERCNIKRAKAIIINEYNDFATMKALLTINGISRENPAKEDDPFIVAVAIHKENVDLFKYVEKDEWRKHIIYYSNQISRIAAHSCIHPGVATAFDEIFDFSGDEIYIEKPKNYLDLFSNSESICYGSILNKVVDGTVIGYKRGKDSILNPPFDAMITKDDDLIILEEWSQKAVINVKNTYEISKVNLKEEDNKFTNDNILIFGANENLPQIVAELNKYMNVDSEIIIACTFKQLRNCLKSLNVEKYSNELEIIKQQLLSVQEQHYIDNRVREIFKYLMETYIAIQNAETSKDLSIEEVVRYANVQLKVCDIYDADSLDLLIKDIQFNLKEEKFEHALILADNFVDANEADEKTLFLLMSLKRKYKELTQNMNITVDIRKVSNQKIVNNSSVDDYIISTNIISNMITQISQNSDLSEIFEELLDIQGNEIYIEKFEEYFDFEDSMSINFYQLTDIITRKARKTPIGYRIKENGNTNIIINPDKYQVYKFTKEDSIILIANDD